MSCSLFGGLLSCFDLGLNLILLVAVPICLAYAAFAGFRMKTKAGTVLGSFAVLGLASIAMLVWFASSFD